jgi:hypothetical protein
MTFGRQYFTQDNKCQKERHKLGGCLASMSGYNVFGNLQIQEIYCK